MNTHTHAYKRTIILRIRPSPQRLKKWYSIKSPFFTILQPKTVQIPFIFHFATAPQTTLHIISIIICTNKISFKKIYPSNTQQSHFPSFFFLPIFSYKLFRQHKKETACTAHLKPYCIFLHSPNFLVCRSLLLSKITVGASISLIKMNIVYLSITPNANHTHTPSQCVSPSSFHNHPLYLHLSLLQKLHII